MEKHKKFNSIIPYILCWFLFTSTNIYSQIDIFEQALKTVDVLNNTLLEITALSDEEENNIGKELDKRITNESKVTKSNKYDVTGIFNKIKKNVKRNRLSYQVKILQDKDINAFAIAGGKTYILTGLLKFIESEDELAFVIAHEIAHNELKHCVKKIQYGVQAAKIEPVFGDVVQIAYNVYQTPYSKYDEYAADKLGVELLKKAGYNIKGAYSFFDKLKKLEEKYGVENRDPLNDFISSHPTAVDRKKKISENEIK
jgi:predicted Zn-dependent protease